MTDLNDKQLGQIIAVSHENISLFYVFPGGVVNNGLRMSISYPLLFLEIIDLLLCSVQMVQWVRYYFERWKLLNEQD